ncbi:MULTISPECIES: Ldh family oxidoreductase [Cupriavidus]|uniref:LDH2 family malate/lactate/ureidoglycolate dehydrogenase n=2 Tax=Cupriavidus TaxID=106589 RepID=A0A7W4VE21_9BURK|nr:MULTISPECIES: Ldh family oxidoreductase [Cupriavidus]MBB3009903.1 LDH2 family malate/lactate/ureidoglycolate dehydrogenase [Cupriavidus alkaliphilus]QBY56222.1 Ldh family oxidoreductase [Cupriavidus oxalaticus]
MTILSIEEARELAHASMVACGHTAAEATIIADHLIDCELRGLGYGGLARCVSLVEYLRKPDLRREPMRVAQETAASAQIEGGNQVGYLVANKATDIAISKARRQGVAVVGAARTWLTGMFSYYLERVTAAGFVGMIAGSGNQLVAPHGGTEPRFCTNPIAFGFPSLDAPVIWDTGTSAITWAEVVLARRLGRPLPEGTAFDPDGVPTTDPAAALVGALAVWGGHRGSGLALSIQLLGMLAGQVNSRGPAFDCGFLILVVDPDLFGEPGEFRRRVSEFARELRATRPLDPAVPVRVPFERSAVERERRLATGVIEVENVVVRTLREACAMKV